MRAKFSARQIEDVLLDKRIEMKEAFTMMESLVVGRTYHVYRWKKFKYEARQTKSVSDWNNHRYDYNKELKIEQWLPKDLKSQRLYQIWAWGQCDLSDGEKYLKIASASYDNLIELEEWKLEKFIKWIKE